MRLADSLPCIVLGLLGLVILSGMTFLPRNGEAVVGGVVAPWISAQEGLRRVVALSIPIMDIRWNGRLIVTDLSEHPEARDGLRRASLFLIRPGASGTCLTPYGA